MRKRVLELGLLLGIMVLAVYMRSEYILDEKEENKYLLGYDPYYHYRVADQILENGERPEWDTLVYAPEGQPLSHPPLFHYYLAYTYKVYSVFSDMSFFNFAIYSNIIIILLCTVIAYLTGKELTNEIGGLFTASLFAVCNAIIKRSVIGFTDTDLFVVFFSFFITYFWLKAINNKTLYKKRIFFSSLTGAAIFLYSITWQGYFYMLSLVLAALGLICIIEIIRTKKLCLKEGEILVFSLLGFFIPYTLYNAEYLYALALVIVTVVILFFEIKIKEEASILFFNFKIKPEIKDKIPYIVGGAILLVVSFIIYKQDVIEIIIPFQQQAAKTILNRGGAMYPTTNVSIRELYQTDIGLLFDFFGVGLVLGPLGIVVSLWKDRNYPYAIYLGLFLIGTYSMLARGGRFSLIMAVPIILGTGLFLGKLYEIINERVPEKKIVSVGVVAMVLIAPLIIVPSYMEADEHNYGQREMTEGWWNALNWINENTTEDATIVSWWDYGYWIEAVGKRKTTMNGGHYRISSRLVKTGALYSTTSESVAMKEVYGFDLNCTEEKALEDLEGLRDWSGSPELKEMEKKDEMEAYADDNAYLIVDEKTAAIFSWIHHYGTWNYNKGTGEKAPIYKFNLAGMGKTQLPTGDAVQYIYQSGNSRIAVFQDYDNNFHAFYTSGDKSAPLMGTLFENHGKKTLLTNKNGGLGVGYLSDHRENIKNEGIVYYNSPVYLYLINPDVFQTMFSRLMFFDGANLNYFELVKSFDTVKIYKVHKEPQKDLNEDVQSREDELFKKLMDQQ
ncbi:MAG: STT3 domain-containing protein [Euryarchaeota archaeon]|nr:STT3 domain-containing protein [Euryarchaeota archaeon]